MAVSPSDPAFLLFFGMDESLPTAVRRNAGSLGSAQDLTVFQSSGSDGAPSVSDGAGGKAIDLFVARTGYTSALRRLLATGILGSAHTCRPAIPLNLAADDFAFGCRFQWKGLNTGGGGNEIEDVFSLVDVVNNTKLWGIGVLPNDPTTPATGTLRLTCAHAAFDQLPVSDANFTVTGGATTNYLVKDRWYRVLVRIFNNGANKWRAKVYVYEESTGTTYTFAFPTDKTVDWSGTDSSLTYRVAVSGYYDTANPYVFGGYVDWCFLFDAPMSDGDATGIVVGGISVPWTAPTYRRADHEVRVSMVREGGTFPKPRLLPTGTPAAAVDIDALCKRARLLVEGFRPGRPWQLREAALIFDTAGPYSSKKGYTAPLKSLGHGMVRRAGNLPVGTPEFVRDMDPTPEGPRRRRGYQVRRIVSTESDVGENAFRFFRTYDDALHGVYKAGTKLYAETGASAALLDAGPWNVYQKPVFLFLGNRLSILTKDRRKSWNGDVTAVQSFGTIVPPPSCTAAVTAGGSLTGAYYYAATEYDPLTGDESAPFLSSIVNPVAQAVALTLGTVSSDTRFSKRRIYRTTNGGTAPDLFLVAEIATATSYTDTGLADGVTPVGQVTSIEDDGTHTLLGYLTGLAPDNFSIGCVHMERGFYGGGDTHGERIYPGEANAPQRWYAGGYLTCDGIVRAIASYGHRLVAFTDSTVELFESDWIRDASGQMSVTHTVVSRRCGALGPHAVVNAEAGGFFWMDRRGIHRFGANGLPEKLSEDIEDLFPWINHGISARVCGSYNHVRGLVCFSVPLARTEFQPDNSRFQTWLVCHASKPTEWWTRQLEATFHGQFDDDLNGLQYGVMDHLGVFKVAEGYEGDGAQGNESYTTEDEGTDGVTSLGISTIVGQVITVFGAPGWTASALRGFAVIFRDRSTGLLYQHLVADNGTATLTVIGTPSALLAARDGWFLGAIDGRWRMAETTLDSPNDKIIRKARFEFGDLDGGLYA
jgi:hypothetical protein